MRSVLLKGHMILKNRDIVLVGAQAWETETGFNARHIALQLARFNRVLYVNRSLDRITLLRNRSDPAVKVRLDRMKNRADELTSVHENVWTLHPVKILESANWLPFTRLFRLFNKVNNKRFATEIRKAIVRLHFVDPILLIDGDMLRSYHLIELLKPCMTIYYSRDYLMGYPYWFKHGRVMEPELLSKCDLVVANSTHLTELARQYNPNSYFIGQGVDLQNFNEVEANCPVQMSTIKRPIIGYLGALNHLRLNLRLLEQLAFRKKEWSFVFIGKEDSAFAQSFLHHLDNVRFLGVKKITEVANYLSCFDVALNPQVINRITIGNYPLKIDEYLALGKPVVASRTEAMEMFSEYVYFATTVEEYEEQIETALREDSPQRTERRKRFAQSHTWENCLQELYKAIFAVRPELVSTKEPSFSNHPS
jgi:teichuronic acid biosynthesis glycosyltransferase TuaH